MSMKMLIKLIFISMLLLGACTKSPEQSREQISPAARSSFTREQLMSEIVMPWVDKDTTTRRIGSVQPTGSMLRVMDSSSIILLEKIGPTDSIGISDILIYKTNINGSELNIAHRLIAINTDGTLVFKGDNNDTNDPIVDRRDVLFRVVAVLYTNGK